MKPSTYVPRSSDSVKDYFNEISRYPLLTANQEISLSRQVEAAQRLQPATPPTAEERRTLKRGQRAKQQLIQCNLRLVVHVAKQYTKRLNGNNLELMDLIQEGAFGLTRAVELFDSTKGYKFSTYAYWWIRQAVARGIDTKERLIRIPQQGIDCVNRANKFARTFLQEQGRAPTLSEIADGADIEITRLELLLQRSKQASSLDAMCVASDTPLIELIPNQSEDGEDVITLQQVDREQMLRVALNCLDAAELYAITKRYGLDGEEPESMAAIARLQDVSRERIRQRIQAAHVKLRLALKRASAVPPPL